ncbi:PLDc N-terminal domain-containing protein [uncultured Jatrophihabitans sp.]|uniref:PLDc N-terminal domain-containing protein n=1 Tax=uncultured Jatrophihabitans sp. TaxID=1610747 RepID=UPI0035C9C2B9
MLFFDGGLGLIMLALWIFCIIDVITTPDGAARNLPKMVWLLIVLILPDIGSIVWLVAGHPWNSTTATLPYKGNRGYAPAPRTSARASNPDDDEEFLANLRRRADEQRRRAREADGSDSPSDETPT